MKLINSYENFFQRLLNQIGLSPEQSIIFVGVVHTCLWGDNLVLKDTKIPKRKRTYIFFFQYKVPVERLFVEYLRINQLAEMFHVLRSNNPKTLENG